MTFVFFGLIFKVLPDVVLTWADVWRGALVTAVMFTIGKELLGVYLSKGSAASAFGAAASLAALLIWVNYSGWILFYGAELTKAQVLAAGKKVAPSKHAMPISQDERVKQGIPDSSSPVRQGGAPDHPYSPPRPMCAPAIGAHHEQRQPYRPDP